MTGAQATSGLRASFGTAAESAKAIAAGYVAHARSRKRFERYVLLAIAALERVAAESRVEAAELRFTAGAAAEAAAVCRTERPGPALAALVVLLEDAARACDGTRTDGGASVPPTPWQRFLFEELDVAVCRMDRRWRIRRRGVEAEAVTLDSALARLASTLSPSRIGQIAFQILDWCETAAAADGTPADS